ANWPSHTLNLNLTCRQNLMTCPREAEAIRLSVNGVNAPDWKDHLADCKVCRQVVKLAEAMMHDAAALRESARVPSPDLLLLIARMRNQQRRYRCVMRPIACMELFAIVVVFALLTVLAIANNSGNDALSQILLMLLAIKSAVVTTIWL